MKRNTPEKLLAKGIHFIAFGFGSGHVPKMPGTIGTLLAIPIAWVLHPQPLGIQITCLIFLFAIGIPICGKTAKDLGIPDHSGIVFDEVVGFLLPLLFIPFTWPWVVIAFALFRVFDIFKPWPIGFIDKKVHGGLGIMLDDLLAGVYTLLLSYGLLAIA